MDPETLILVRHGESLWNANKTFTGEFVCLFDIMLFIFDLAYYICDMVKILLSYGCLQDDNIILSMNMF